MAEAKTTTDDDEIRRWVESRGGDDDTRLERLSWEEWFEAFDANELAFLYQDEGDSHFNKLVSRD